MWFLFWFQLINKKDAVVLITGSNTAMYCFEAKSKG